MHLISTRTFIPDKAPRHKGCAASSTRQSRPIVSRGVDLTAVGQGSTNHLVGFLTCILIHVPLASSDEFTLESNSNEAN